MGRACCHSAFTASSVALRQGSVPSFEPICSEPGQCREDCCFYAGYCTTSDDNLCNAQVGDTFFPPAPGTDGLSTHNPSDGTKDGCECNQNITEYNGEERLACDQNDLTGTAKCWGTIECADPSKTCDFSNGGSVRYVPLAGVCDGRLMKTNINAMSCEI